MKKKKDMIISDGENIYPAEIENVLAEMEQIAEAAVSRDNYGIPNFNLKDQQRRAT
ncbi:MAG: hypothetical protein KAR15_08045 [Desulfobacterales bacterium]|nr:hypothetical protein [Desulfobacterales bacterium]